MTAFEEESTKFELETAPFDSLVGEELVAFAWKASPEVVRARFAKALDHLTKAERLRGIDEEMAVIRLIAGEEELVVAIFEWLKIQGDHFPEHKDFVRQFKKHPIKQSLHPVLREFRWVIEELLSSGFTFDGLEDVINWTATPVVDDDKGVVVSIRDDIKEVLRIEPLAFAITRPDLEDDKIAQSLFEAFVEHVGEQGMTVREYLLRRADYRNKLLYASDAGPVGMKESLDEMLAIFRPVYRDLIWTLAVLLGGNPPSKEWGLVSQFFEVYRRVLVEAELIKAPR